MHTRTTGTMALALLALVSGILSFIAGWWLMLGGTVGAVAGSSLGGTVIIFGSLQFALGLVELFVGYAFWRMVPWAWSGGIVVFGVSIALDLASVPLAGADPMSIVVSVVVAAAAIWYLFQPKVKLAYGR
jgi:hypothetical protein